MKTIIDIRGLAGPRTTQTGAWGDLVLALGAAPRRGWGSLGVVGERLGHESGLRVECHLTRNAGLDALADLGPVADLLPAARHVLLEIVGAQTLSNPYYRVHRRRNDRFIAPTGALEALFPEVDFVDYADVTGLLEGLVRVSPERLDIVRAALQDTWVAAMRRLIRVLDRPVTLVWLPDRPLSDAPWHSLPDGLQAQALFVSKAMVDALRPLGVGVVGPRLSPDRRGSLSVAA